MSVLQYDEFIKEYYQPSPSTGTDMIRLYRGDSNYVDKFDVDKFEKDSVFGPGQYLTDMRHIAKTYTTKGDKGKVVWEFTYSGDDAMKKNKAKLYFICTYLMYKLAGKPVPNENYDYMTQNSSQYDMSSYNFFEYKERLLLRGYDMYAPYSTEMTKKELATHNKYVKNLRKEHERMESLYGEMFDNAVAYMKKNPRRYSFILIRGGYETNWEVIDSSIKQGHISEFDIPKSVLDCCYDATTPITLEVIKIIGKCWDADAQASELETGIKRHRFKEWYNPYNQAKIKNLSDFVSNAYAMRSWKIETWNMFHKLMNKQGIPGIRYLGGHFTESPIKHNAYVLWDLTKLKRLV